MSVCALGLTTRFLCLIRTENSENLTARESSGRWAFVFP